MTLSGFDEGTPGQPGHVFKTASALAAAPVWLDVIVLDVKPLNACPAFANSQGRVDVAQLVKGVNNALHGCGGLSHPASYQRH